MKKTNIIFSITLVLVLIFVVGILKFSLDWQSEKDVIINNQTGSNFDENSGSTIEKNQVNQKQELDIQKILSQLKTKEEIINERQEKYFEEISYVETYGTQNSFYEYYLLLSVKNNDVNECNKIEKEEEKQLCIDLFNSKDDELTFIENYKGFYLDDDLDYGKSMFQVYNSIANGKCDTDDIIVYLACKKTLDSKTDVRDIFLNYSILQFSNLEIGKTYYSKLSDFWGYDEVFKNIVKYKLFNQE